MSDIKVDETCLLTLKKDIQVLQNTMQQQTDQIHRLIAACAKSAAGQSKRYRFVVTLDIENDIDRELGPAMRQAFPGVVASIRSSFNDLDLNLGINPYCQDVQACHCCVQQLTYSIAFELWLHPFVSTQKHLDDIVNHFSILKNDICQRSWVSEQPAWGNTLEKVELSRQFSGNVIDHQAIESRAL